MNPSQSKNIPDPCRLPESFRPFARDMKGLNPRSAEQAEAERDELLRELSSKARAAFYGTKIFLGQLSPGCMICVQGRWSCLFVNGLCQAHCFFCPSPQEKSDAPKSQTLTFHRPRDYVEYLRRFRFRGVGLSGGEPLLTPERTLSFLSHIRRGKTPVEYIWLYTNGLAATPGLLRSLRDGGLDEIRFNLAASGYDLSRLRPARTILPTVTVEIPAVPEDEPLLLDLLPDLVGAGVDHLNLHQLRVTAYNLPGFLRRNYTFLSGPGVTVLESELSALRILREISRRGLPLSAQYCSYAYRSQRQVSAARRQAGRPVRRAFEKFTETGLIHTMEATGADRALMAARRRLEEIPAEFGFWQVDRAGSQIIIHPALLPLLSGIPLDFKSRLFSPRLRENPSYQHPFRKIRLNPERTLVVEMCALPATESEGNETPPSNGERIKPGLTPFRPICSRG